MPYSEISFELGFENGEKTKLTQGPYDPDDPQLQMVKASAMMINNNSLAQYQAYVRNEDDSPVKALNAIVGASITTVARTTYI